MHSDKLFREIHNPNRYKPYKTVLEWYQPVPDELIFRIPACAFIDHLR